MILEKAGLRCKSKDCNSRSLLTPHGWIFTKAQLHSPTQKWPEPPPKVTGAGLKQHCIAAAETEQPGLPAVCWIQVTWKAFQHSKDHSRLWNTPSKPWVLPLLLLPQYRWELENQGTQSAFHALVLALQHCSEELACLCGQLQRHRFKRQFVWSLLEIFSFFLFLKAENPWELKLIKFFISGNQYQWTVALQFTGITRIAKNFLLPHYLEHKIMPVW